MEPLFVSVAVLALASNVTAVVLPPKVILPALETVPVWPLESVWAVVVAVVTLKLLPALARGLKPGQQSRQRPERRREFFMRRSERMGIPDGWAHPQRRHRQVLKANMAHGCQTRAPSAIKP